MHADLSAACRGVKTLTAELGLSGRAGRERLRGRVLAGFGAPDSMRLEGVAPFGAPAFILVARGGQATLLLPRANGVLRAARPDDILGALTGVALAPADLLAILTGCGVPAPAVERGVLHANGWASLYLKGGTTLYLQPVSAGWQIRVARRPGWTIEYPEWGSSGPRVVRLRSDAGAHSGASPRTPSGPMLSAPVDLTAAISQLEMNVDLDPAAFAVDVPASAAPITLEELRDAGPLSGN